MARTVRRFATPYTFSRPSAADGVSADGYPTPATEVEVDAMAFVHPNAGRRVARNDTGHERRSDIKGYANVPVRVADQATGVRGDRLTFNGIVYEVDSVSLWTSGRAGQHVWYAFGASEVKV